MAASDSHKKRLFDDSDDESDGGVKLQINSEYAKRFEHNKKREEMHRLEEKYKSKQSSGDKSKAGNDEDDDSSSDETEDENGFLATEDLDAEISATLQAIKNKDPRVYDTKTTFYKSIDESATAEDTSANEKKEKPVFLKDYHREKILRGDTGADFDNVKEPPQTYTQEQDDLKKSIKDEIKAQLEAGDDAESSDSDEDFLKAKEETRTAPENGIHPSRAGKIKAPKPDVTDADKDPELFLSNFMASRAWVEEDATGWKAFESDEGEDEKADEWEAAYNLRFEDPNKSNEVLKSYSRDVVAARSVRREDKTARKKQREMEREKLEDEKQKRKEEKARLRRLKLDEAEGKLKKIKKAAGLSGKTLQDEEWQKLLEDAWENDKWEDHLRKTFDEQYYAAAEEEVSDDEDEDGANTKKSKKVKKPKWDDDIDIKDLIPDFDDEERPKITLTDDEQDEEDNEDEDAPTAKRQKSSKERKREKLASQKEVRQERAKLEAFVDAKMEIDDPEILGGSSSSRNKGSSSTFAYRETRPESFGLTTRDILMASDADLNQYAGLKKLAHFRPQDKQSKDRKRLGKKARLRQWRKETFGPEFEREPPAYNPGGAGAAEEPRAQEAGTSNIIEGGSKKKRKRSGRSKKAGKEEVVA
ncbi:Krr1-domain-containing protein [Annulohypoxylon maeteangense]|uniref:Krr1-domain-containing protein n=1 Tax=Annulohypoxylon maeteangense TaxID=1927788 RepID=UPI002008ADF4|nr:Krr1-domain-containing protein [Annulohypoxylon maeteangense]KAI0887443.1 Krr1-domain-containing protein [Annulohypoxylon maeteangense]